MVVSFSQLLALGAGSQVAGRGTDGNSFHSGIATASQECTLHASKAFGTYSFIKMYKTVTTHSQTRCVSICSSKTEMARGHMATQELGSVSGASGLPENALRPVTLEAQPAQRRGPHFVRCLLLHLLPV